MAFSLAAGPARAEEHSPAVAPDSPRQAYLDFVKAALSESAVVGSYLDKRGVPAGSDAATMARQLLEVIERRVAIDVGQLSAAPEGDLDDGLPPHQELLGTVLLDDAQVPIMLVRSPKGASLPWRFARETVREVPKLYAKFGDGVLSKVLPSYFFRIEFLQLRLWQWIGLVVAFLGAHFLSWLVALAATRVAGALARRTKSKIDDELVESLASPFRYGLLAALVWLGVNLLYLPLAAIYTLAGFVKGAAIVTAVWALFRLTDVIAAAAGKKLLASGRASAYSVLPIGRKSAKAFFAVIACLGLLQNFGVNVTALLAGLGVGGLAIALASQKTLEHLLGGIMISVDQPVRVGDFCKFGDKVGTVEDIGLRSVRVRTLDRTIVAIPNAEFAQIQLENFSARDKMRLFATIGLRYETSSEVLRKVLEETRKLLRSHPKIDPSLVNVRFVSFGASSLDVEIFTYILTSDWNEFLALREEIWLKLMDTITACGSGLAFPSQTHYIAQDRSLDAEGAEAARALLNKAPTTWP